MLLKSVLFLRDLENTKTVDALPSPVFLSDSLPKR